MDSIPWEIVGPWSGWAAFLSLAWFTVRGVQRGDLVPRKTHERELDRSEHDANEWRTEGRIKDAQIAEQARQLSHMGEVGRTMEQVLGALQSLRKDGAA